MERLKNNLIVRIAALLLLVGLIAFFSWRLMPQVTHLFKNPEQFRSLLLAFGNWSLAVFIGLQILQVIAAPLPGELIQIAGGYVYGVFTGTLLSMLGILVGSLMAFYLARWLGYPLLQALISKEKLEHFHNLLNSNRAEVIVFVLFLVPGAPKDILTFIAGATPIPSGHFFLAAMLGRFPGILVSSLIGAQLEKHQYFLAGILGLAAATIFLLGIIYHERLTRFLARHHHHRHQK
ncbi:MAG: TVP38/TMEM64 family protein [Syntrophomonas sp.]